MRAVPACSALVNVEPEFLALVEQLKQRLRRRFGNRFDGLHLFGSRARGDAEPDSDAEGTPQETQ
jgi:predicted nucleotidyltransferase